MKLPAMHKALWPVLVILFIVSTATAEVKVGTWRTAQTIQPFFYHQFLDEGTLVEILPFTNPADQKNALLAGSLAMTGTTLAHAIHSASQGQPIVIVAALCNRASALVVNNNSDIHQVTDLRGKTIGYVPGTMHEILLRETLERNGLSSATDVKLMRVDFFDMGTALARGNIDAFLSGEPFPTLAVAQGYGRIMSYPYYEDAVGTINAAMIVTRNTIESDPETVGKLVRAHIDATRWLNEHPDQWLAAAAQFGTPLPILQQAATNIELTWNIDETFVHQVKTLGARMQALGVIDRQPDYERLFDFSFVNNNGANP